MNPGESKAEIPFKQGELFNPEDYAGDLLLTQEQFNAISRLEDKGCIIAERLKKRLPKTYQLVVACRSAGISIRQTMEICQVGYAVVAEIDKREKNSIDAAKEKIRAKCYYNPAALADLSGLDRRPCQARLAKAGGIAGSDGRDGKTCRERQSLERGKHGKRGNNRAKVCRLARNDEIGTRRGRRNFERRTINQTNKGRQ